MSTITFHTLLNTSFPVTFIESSGGTDALQRAILRLTIEVSWAEYDQIAANEWFNFHTYLRPANEETLLEEAKPVQLELGLRAPLFEWLLSTVDRVSTDDVLDLFTSASESEYAFLLESESWNVYTVKQKQPLPDGVEGEVSLGFATHWVARPGVQSLIEEVGFLLGTSGWKFEKFRDNLFRTTIVQAAHQWRCLVQVDPDNAFIMVYSIYPELVPEQRRADVLIALNSINYELAVGNFEMDTDDGELRFRTSVDVEGATEITALFQRLFLANLGVMEAYLPTIAGIIAGG